MIRELDYEWSIEQALPIVREIEKEVRVFNYYTALTGSVLHNGSSIKDLDIMLMPLSGDCVRDMDKVVLFLREKYRSLEYRPPDFVTDKEYNDDSRLFLIGSLGDKRIDFFVYYPPEAEDGK